jgi:hypothetical protein
MQKSNFIVIGNSSKHGHTDSKNELRREVIRKGRYIYPKNFPNNADVIAVLVNKIGPLQISNRYNFQAATGCKDPPVPMGAPWPVR